jgi:uncharacterized membrane protein
MKRWKSSLLGFAAIAVASNYALYMSIPYLVMYRTMHGIANHAGGFNIPVAGNLPDATSRTIVKPSPDLLYTACAFDVSKGPVLVGSAPSPTYWSMALYASNTDNFFVVNDRRAQGAAQFVVLATPNVRDQIPDKYKSFKMVEPPSGKGIALQRYLVVAQEDFAKIEEVQRRAVCQQIQP